jgi:hypothetical protein
MWKREEEVKEKSSGRREKEERMAPVPFPACLSLFG